MANSKCNAKSKTVHYSFKSRMPQSIRIQTEKWYNKGRRNCNVAMWARVQFYQKHTASNCILWIWTSFMYTYQSIKKKGGTITSNCIKAMITRAALSDAHRKLSAVWCGNISSICRSQTFVNHIHQVWVFQCCSYSLFII